MIETTTKCDVCKKTVPNDAVFVINIDQRMHDLCELCHVQMKKIFAGTGREISAPLILSPGLSIFNSPSIPQNPYLGQTVGMVNTPNLPQDVAITYTNSNNNGLSASNMLPFHPTAETEFTGVLSSLIGLGFDPPVYIFTRTEPV